MNIEPDLLMVALKGADEIVRDKFMSNMSERARAVFLDDMGQGPCASPMWKMRRRKSCLPGAF